MIQRNIGKIVNLRVVEEATLEAVLAWPAEKHIIEKTKREKDPKLRSTVMGEL